ncbi:phosphoribosyl-AMP cyclohydrolase [Streptomonospora litoralis]|uniref:Phosphoribosyl-AMP cyclohydrolase n=1 Tax=Streptomonospora litoralis TaxID=2498135 RepID=A0A4P6Q4Q1_9ACTN|nr:phosphoribosyl-AMP cyclohydrolase [Streptomonospora litoralis]QBI53939.1 phosphoribosyl-AMP cyclohydrolase [Streptomonospora litoralis]
MSTSPPAGAPGTDAGPRLAPEIAERLTRNSDGLLPAIVQQHDTGEVLMLAWMDDEALRRTLDSGRATYWSRSRREYWVKGATSGNVQAVVGVALDCDGDTLLLRVDQSGPACHTGAHTCFDEGELPLGGGSAPAGGVAR